jgi:hypothetical protein
MLDRNPIMLIQLSAHSRDPPALASSYGGFESAEARSAKAESGDPAPCIRPWIPAFAGMSGTSRGAILGRADDSNTNRPALGFA